jgi:FkbM family methyltransferase
MKESRLPIVHPNQITSWKAQLEEEEVNCVLSRSLQVGSVQGMLMPLPFREKLTMLMPPSLFYRRRIAEETRSGEPELAVLAKLVPRGGTAIDVGANLGFFAYALSDIADWVVAFEPNPDYAFFARWMLRGRAEVHQLALSDVSGRGTLYVPLSDRGMVLHLAGSLKQTHSHFRNIKTYDVEVRTLDEFGLMGVRFVKADVEGSEREVLDGARATIARDRPIILLAVLTRTLPLIQRRSARTLATTHSSSNAARRSQRCPRSPPSARMQVGEPTSSRGTCYSCRDEGYVSLTIGRSPLNSGSMVGDSPSRTARLSPALRLSEGAL